LQPGLDDLPFGLRGAKLLAHPLRHPLAHGLGVGLIRPAAGTLTSARCPLSATALRLGNNGTTDHDSGKADDNRHYT
jgi:hypothetical protein